MTFKEINDINKACYLLTVYSTEHEGQLTPDFAKFSEKVFNDIYDNETVELARKVIARLA
jgi:hypothetical protein